MQPKNGSDLICGFRYSTPPAGWSKSPCPSSWRNSTGITMSLAEPLLSGADCVANHPNRPIDPGPRRRLNRPSSVTNRIAWRYAVPIAGIHLLACTVCVPWLFSWTGVLLAVAGTYLYGGLGINIAYHRLL